MMDTIREFFEYLQVDWLRLAKAIWLVAAVCACVGSLMYWFVAYPLAFALAIVTALLGWIIYVVYDEIM